MMTIGKRYKLSIVKNITNFSSRISFLFFGGGSFKSYILFPCNVKHDAHQGFGAVRHFKTFAIKSLVVLTTVNIKKIILSWFVMIEGVTSHG